MCTTVKDGEQMALETLVDLFNWLGGVDPQATIQISPLGEPLLMKEFLKTLRKCKGVAGRFSSALLVRVVS